MVFPTTTGRVLTGFEARNWIIKTGRTYRFPGFGVFVATWLWEFRDAMGVERSLREVSPTLPHELDNFSRVVR